MCLSACNLSEPINENNMDARIKATDFEMTTAVSDYLDEKLEAIEKHLGSDAEITRAEIEIGRAAGHSKHGENFFAEFQVMAPGVDAMRVVAHGTTVNAAIDAAKDEMLLKLKKDKTKREGNVRRIGGKIKEWMRWGA